MLLDPAANLRIVARALIEYSLVMLARSFKWRSKAKCSGVKCGGQIRRGRRETDCKSAGLLGLSAGHGGLGLLGLFEHTNSGVSIGIEHNRSPLLVAIISACLA